MVVAPASRRPAGGQPPTRRPRRSAGAGVIGRTWCPASEVLAPLAGTEPSDAGPSSPEPWPPDPLPEPPALPDPPQLPDPPALSEPLPEPPQLLPEPPAAAPPRRSAA